MRRAGAVAAVVAGVVLVGITAATVFTGNESTTVAPSPVAAAPVAPGDQLTVSIAKAQQILQGKPNDWATWAVLGSAYVQKARVTADPSYYPKSEGALQKSLDLHPDGNDAALTGMGALDNARHEFGKAADLARQAQAINGYGSTSYGVLADALIQLGDYDGATAAAQRMLDLKPGVSSFTRASYDLELHGRTDEARAVLQKALDDSTDALDVAFCRTYLGELAFNQGDLDGADKQYTAGLALTPDEPNLLLGQARVQAARGQDDSAVASYQHVVDLRPLPASFVEYGQLLESLGRTAEANVQYALYGTAQQLFTSNGVRDSLTGALLDANRGEGDSAVAQGRAEYAARQNIDAADALGWALHAAGRDSEALPYAQQATALGTRNASFLYHRGIIEQSLGMTPQARATLTSALAINPYFSPLFAPKAQQALTALGGPE
ncbi:tetratricopeptide repeat protein [Rhodococcus antarcticus]|uniref:Tetratricopeptide repeat protein n=1 Tax=Rhodococcus antarcticus TaxID=2987751 RepID=A0ABY6NX43_9NOCA|nr:tetratricopeptide repeat protein [Rhodococcus antarcticus]UZJ23513.1 tetratricopeptide repeat protein [Rhodococcus antarcticus]